MKILKLIGLGFVVAVILSGCSLKNQGNYTAEYVSKSVDLNKGQISKPIVVKKHREAIITKHPSTLRGKLSSVEMRTSDIGDGVSKMFMDQYFDDVTISENGSNAFMEVDIRVIDYNYNFAVIADSVEMDISIEANIKKEGKLILSKKYNQDVGDNNLLSFTVFGGDLTLHGQTVETFHKGILSILEEQVKPDLIKALKENP